VKVIEVIINVLALFV